MTYVHNYESSNVPHPSYHPSLNETVIGVMFMPISVLLMLKITLSLIKTLNASGEGDAGEPSISNFQWEKSGGDIGYHSAKEQKHLDYLRRVRDAKDVQIITLDHASESVKKAANLKPLMNYFKKKVKKQNDILNDLALVRKLPGPKTRNHLAKKGKLHRSSNKK